MSAVAAAAPAATRLLILTCDHGGACPGEEPGGGVVRLRLPCVQLVSDDFLLLAAAAGAAAVAVVPDAACPNSPHRGPARAVAIAAAALAAPGRGAWRAAHDEEAGALVLSRSDGVASARASIEVPEGPRYERRAALLAALGIGGGPPADPPPDVVPWRGVAVGEDCNVCGACAANCPSGALSLSPRGSALLGRERLCIGCGKCEALCPLDTLRLTPTVPSGPGTRLLARRP
jgi:ferredoxin